MELRQLSYFLSIAREHSFSRASERLYISQPALSRQIQMLEGEIGLPLFNRTPRGVELTEAGLRLMEMAEFVLQYVAEMPARIGEGAKEPSGRVALGLSSSISALIGTRLADETSRRYPKIELQIFEGLSPLLCEWITQSRLDLAVVTSLGPVKDVEQQEMLRDEIVFVGSASMLRDYQGSIPLAEATKFPLIVASGFGKMINDRLAAESVELHYDRVIDSISILKSTVLHGRYCTFFPSTFIHEEVGRGELKALRFLPEPFHRHIVAAVKAGRPLSLAVKTVQALINEELQALPT